MSVENYSNIRNFLGPFIGKRVVDITQHDEDEFDPKNPMSAYIEFLFEGGGTARIFTIGCNVGPAFVVQHHDDCGCDLCINVGGK